MTAQEHEKTACRPDAFSAAAHRPYCEPQLSVPFGRKPPHESSLTKSAPQSMKVLASTSSWLCEPGKLRHVNLDAAA